MTEGSRNQSEKNAGWVYEGIFVFFFLYLIVEPKGIWEEQGLYALSWM